MYVIYFHQSKGKKLAYAGGTFKSRGEKFAAVNNDQPKLFKSEKVARSAAEKLFLSCENTGTHYTIEEFL